MVMPRFFFPGNLPGKGCVDLPGPLAHHATRVLRLRDGSAIVLFDGSGGEVRARLRSRGKVWQAELLEYAGISRESPLHLVLVQALASGEKMDWIVQKAVELGVTAIIPLAADRSVLRLVGERAEKRVAHWRQIAISACEQSGRNRIPEVLPVIGAADYLRRFPECLRMILSPAAEAGVATLSKPETAVHLLIGPEGGWSEGELRLWREADSVSLSLGPRILRTETAGLAALAVLQSRWGDF